MKQCGDLQKVVLAFNVTIDQFLNLVLFNPITEQKYTSEIYIRSYVATYIILCVEPFSKIW